jgi:protein phosphatase slingshot
MEYIKNIKSGIYVFIDKSSEAISNIFNSNENINNNMTRTIKDEDVLIQQPIKQEDIIKVNDKPKYIITKDGSTRYRIFPQIASITQMKIFFEKPHHIIDNIYLGSAFNASHSTTLKNLNIGLIINVTSEISNYYPNKYKYKKYTLVDNNSESIKQYFKDSYLSILEYQNEENNKNILIHCFMGASRSVSIVIYYLMKKHNYSLNDAIHFIRNKRHIINPTILFYKELYDSQSE